VLASVMLALGACSGSAAEDAAPVTSPAPLRASGPLTDGFEIEPGSALIGAIFPLNLGAVDGHQAVLRVDDDVQHVFEGYLRQAKELGYPMESGLLGLPPGQWCSDPNDRITEDDPPEPYQTQCTAFGWKEEQFLVQLRGTVETDGGGYIHFSRGSYSRSAPPSRATPLATQGKVAPDTDVELAPDLTATDEPLVRLVEGSALIAEPFPSICETGGYLAVLQVRGDLIPVMRGYMEQFADAGYESEGISGDDDESRLFAFEREGGKTVSVIGVAGDPSHILIERCTE